MARYSELAVKFTGDPSDLQQAFRVVNADLAKTASQVTRQSIGFQQLGSSMSSMGMALTAGVTAPLGLLAAASLKSAGAMEQTEVAFRTMLKSTEAAKQKMEELKAFAAATPFQFPELVDAARRMMALGFASQETLPMLRIIGDAASALGLGAEGINRITLALGQMKAKGTAQAEEMRQLAEAGIPAWESLAKVLGVSVAEAMQMVEKRSVSAQTAIDAVTKAMTERFGGGMEAQSKTLVGMWSNVKDSIGFALADIGGAMAPAAKAIITDFIQPTAAGLKDLATSVNELPPLFKGLTYGITGFAVAIGPLILGMGALITAAAKVAPLVAAVKVALVGVAAAAAPVAGTIGAVALGIAGLSAAIYGLYKHELGYKMRDDAKNTEYMREATANLIESFKTGDPVIRGVVEAVDKDIAATNAAAAAHLAAGDGVKTHAGAYKELLGAMQGPATLMDELSTRMAALAQADASEGLKATAQAIYEVTQYSTEAGAAVELLGKRLYDAGANSSVIAQRMGEVKDAILGAFVDPIQVDFSNVKLDSPWTKEDQAQLNQFEKSIKNIEAASAKEEWQGLFKPITEQRKVLKEVSTVMTDMSRGIASAIVHWKGFGDVGKKVLEDIAQAILRNLIQGAFANLSKAITGCFGQLQGLGGALAGIFGGGGGGGLLSGAVGLTGIFRSNGGSNPLKGMGGVFDGVNWGQFGGAPAGAATSAAGSLAGMGLSSVTGMVTGAISAVTGIIGGFQMMGMNKSLDILVKHTLQLVLQGEVMRSFLDNRLVSIHDRLMEFRTYGIGVWPQEGYNWAGAGPGGSTGGGITINVPNASFIGFRDLDQFLDEIARKIKSRL